MIATGLGDEQLASSRELQATLDAAFDLIDECLTPVSSHSGIYLGTEREEIASSNDGASASDSSSSPALSPPSCSRCAAPASAPGDQLQPPPATASRWTLLTRRPVKSKAQGQTRVPFEVRQKQEIARLRQEASQLAAHLELLQQLSDCGRSIRHWGDDPTHGMVLTTAVEGQMHSMTRSDVVALWKDMAVRHRRLRSVSEAENAQLRLKVAGQRKALHSIQKLLRRQAALETTTIPRSMPTIRSDLSAASTVVMAALSDEIEATYKNLDLSLQLFGLGLGSTVPTQERLWQQSPTSFVVQVVESRLIPFGFRDTAETMWGISMSLRSHSDFFQKQTTVERGGTLFRTYEMEPSGSGRQFTIKGDHALRKFVEPERFVFVKCGIARPTIVGGVGVSGVVCRETGRVVFSRERRVSGGCSDLCRLQTCLEIVVEIDGVLSSGTTLAQDVRSLLAAHKVKSMGVFHGTLEATLLRAKRPDQDVIAIM